MPSRVDQAVKELDRLYSGEYEVFPAILKQPGHVGVSESFKEIIRRNYDEKEIQIFEDDVLFTSLDSRRVFEENMPEEFDVYLGGSYSYEQIEDLGSLLRVNKFASLHCVVIRKNAYDKFISHDPKVVDNIDVWVSSQGVLSYICNPQVAIQRPGFSYNRGRNVDYTYKLRDKKILK